MSELNTLSLDSPDLSIADYRALRAGETVTAPAAAGASEAEPAVKPAAEAEPAAKPEGADTSGEPKEEPKTEKPDRLKVRFSELTAKIRALETELAAKAGAGRTEDATKPAATSATTAAPDPEPDPNKFTDYSEYQKALIRWEVKQERQAEIAKAAEAAKRAEAAKAADAWSQRVAAASEAFEDFETVALNPELPVTPVMADAIRDSEAGPQVLYHLGQHPDEAARIAKLAPLAQVRELGRLEVLAARQHAKSSDPAVETAPPTPKPAATSKAPAPIKPVSGAAAVSQTAKAVDSMSLAEYRALRESGKLR